LNSKQKGHRIAVQAAFALTFLLGASTPTFAREGTKPAMENWRPKDGLYASPGANFHDRCLERTEVFVELADKSIGGDEYE